MAKTRCNIMLDDDIVLWIRTASGDPVAGSLPMGLRVLKTMADGGISVATVQTHKKSPEHKQTDKWTPELLPYRDQPENPTQNWQTAQRLRATELKAAADKQAAIDDNIADFTARIHHAVASEDGKEIRKLFVDYSSTIDTFEQTVILKQAYASPEVAEQKAINRKWREKEAKDKAAADVYYAQGLNIDQVNAIRAKEQREEYGSLPQPKVANTVQFTKAAIAYMGNPDPLPEYTDDQIIEINNLAALTPAAREKVFEEPAPKPVEKTLDQIYAENPLTWNEDEN